VTRARICCLLLPALLAACGEEEAKPDPELLLVFDGIEVRFADVEPYVEFLGSFLPESGRKARIMRALDEQVLPVALARRAFPGERKQQLERARELCSVATNVHELEEQTRTYSPKARRDYTRLHMLPIAMFLFEPLNLGSVSDPIELPAGYVVVGAFDLKESALLLDDYADTLQVGFETHPPTAWSSWLAAEKQRVSSKVTYVHPDYREAMPPWLELPRQP
jgi:hypothetical protein